MDTERLLLAITGAVVGVFGWLLVGLYINRREYARRARNAGRAVYFELTANQLAVFTALSYGAFGQLSRATAMGGTDGRRVAWRAGTGSAITPPGGDSWNAIPT